MELSFVKTSFCPSEIREITQLISEGYGRSRSDIVRKATIEFITRNKMERRNDRSRSNKQVTQELIGAG